MTKHQFRVLLLLGLCLLLALPSALADRPVPPPLEIGQPAETQPTPLEISRQEAEEIACAFIGEEVFAWDATEMAEQFRIESKLYDYPDAPGHPFWSVKLYAGNDADFDADRPDLYMELDARTGEWYRYGDVGAGLYSLIDEEWLWRVRGAQLLWGPRDRWSMEQAASFDAWMLELGYYEGDYFRSVYGRTVLPGPEDLPQEEARRIAQQGITEKYGLDKARLEAYDVLARLTEDLMPNENDELTSYWIIHFTPKPGSGLEEEGAYYVGVSSPSGVLLGVESDADDS